MGKNEKPINDLLLHANDFPQFLLIYPPSSTLATSHSKPVTILRESEVRKGKRGALCRILPI